ncbi:MAG TPA: DUF1761 family protein [Terriglobales bacterium]
MKRVPLSILVAALAHWVFGALWFTAFSKPWIAGTRIPAEEIARMQVHPSIYPYVLSFILNAVIAGAIL